MYQRNNLRVNNYTLISGATSTLGTQIVKKLAPKKNLILHSTSLQKLENLKKKLKKKKLIIYWVCDFKNLEDISKSYKKNLKNFYVSDFIHCASISKILKIKDFYKEYYLNIFNVNLFSAVEIIKNLTLKFNIKKLNNVILISALYSRFGSRFNSMYSSSKGALNSLCKSLAVELAPIRVNCILPGSVKTNMTKDLYKKKEYKKYLLKKYLIQNKGGEEIANFVDYLIFSENWITGQEIIIDGGASANLFSE
jgi:3-oxoacyl-[acyl-carrier protein] reductase